MKSSQKILFYFSFLVLFQSCSKIDDFMLGKDNTPKPTELEQVTPKINLVQNWTVPVGKTKANDSLKLKPLIKGSIIYTASSNGLVQAIDKSSGKPIWSRQVKSEIISGPSVAEGYIALGTNSSTVLVLQENNGNEVWEGKISGDALSAPLIAKDKLLVKSIDGNLFAFNLQNGQKLWTVDHGSPNLILKASSSPILMNDLALVGFSDGRLNAVDLKSGTVVWERSIAYPSGASDVERLVDIDADPIVRGDLVYLASYQGYVGALSIADGQFKWHKPASTYKNLAIDQQNIYMTDSDDIVWAIDRQNGQVKWKQEAFKARVLTEPVLSHNQLIIGDKTGVLHILSTQNGEVLGRTQLGGPITSAPAVSGNHIYVMTANGRLSRMTLG